MTTKFTKKFWNNEGITLLEVMISITIFGIALSAISFLLTTNLFNADGLRNNSVAAGLAQEGIEIVRNIRDQEWLTSGTFANNLANGVYEGQWNSTILTPSSSRILQKDIASGIFSYDGGDATIFKREITITTISANEKRISVVVSWNSRSGLRTLQAEDHLFNWY